MDVDDDEEPPDSLLAAVARIPAKDIEDWAPPPELDEYRLVKPLGRGGMGSVWLAEDQLLERLVAIKFIAVAELDAHDRERFAIEARAAARLQHSNVVTVHRFGEIAGRPYLVSEYIRGDSLDKVAKPMPWERVIELGVALARGLAAAHRHGIVHRDIKPANAILSNDGEVKLVDFGLAKLGEGPTRDSTPVIANPIAYGTARTQPARSDGLLTAPGAIAGTPLYLAPEVRRGEPASRRSDVYQVGCILYELVTGRAPLFDLPGGPPAAQTAEVPSLAPHVGAEGVKLAAIVDRCLRLSADDRFASGEELREALERIAGPQIGGELPEGNPYRGLVAFEAEHRALFFGRGAEIRAVIERLRSDPFVLVTGDSGVGKSSLCRAGVLPHISDGAFGDGLSWKIVQLVPGQHPLAMLASAITTHVEIDEAQLREQPADVARELRRALGRTTGLVIFVDQLEELVTIADDDEAMAFARVLAQLAGTPSIRILATVRGDFVTRVAELPPLEGELARALYVLRPLSSDGAREAIVGPARAKGGRFESEALIDTLVAAAAADATAARAHVELPLLAFTLAGLWEARDPVTQTISAHSLEAIGGVRGALARHADGVIEELLPAQRTAARRLLARLVTPERTRERRSSASLGADHDPVARAALDALVRSRLVVVRGSEPPMYELAHERLIDGWPTLADWLSKTAELRTIHARLATASAEWVRMQHSKEMLWRKHQLADLARLDTEDLTQHETAFATASRRAIRRGRNARIALAIAVPAIAASFYVGARLVADRDLATAIENKVGNADRDVALARTASSELDALRATSVAEFEAGQNIDESWGRARQRESQAAEAYARASRALEAALLLDPERRDVRRRLAEVIFERIQLADRMYRVAERDDLKTRLALYDEDSDLARRLSAPARVDLAIEPRDATITLEPGGTRITSTTADLAPGTYVIVAQAPGRATVRESVFVRSGDTKRIELTLPTAAAVPPDYVYIPPGEFLFGSRDEEPIRRFLATAPMHPRKTPGYLIGRTEVTYRQWIEFLDDLPAADRERHAPQVEKTTTIHKSGGVVLERGDAGWRLQFSPAGKVYEAAAGQPIVYEQRTKRQQQDWLRMPVSGITADDARAYGQWLHRTKRLPNARLCTEPEWERAARGADGRMFPNGDQPLAPDDANFDETYARQDAAFGPDEVGAHPATRSPYGLDDTAGNLWEITLSPKGEFLLRGGSYYTGVYAAVLSNRGETVTSTFRHVFVGVRICADS